MQFFEKPTSCFFVSRDSLVFLSLKGGSPKRLIYDETVLSFGEIINDKKFEELTNEFLESLGHGGKVIILLSDEIVYNKKIPESDSSNLLEIGNDFLNKVPVETHKIAKSVLQTQRGTVLFAIDKIFVKRVVSLFIAKNWQILHIIPTIILGIDEEDELLLYGDVVPEALKAVETNPMVDFLGQI